MKVLSFKVKGKMAHFRKYYANSSALSYSVPPRTTVCGMLAGLLGWERDSYYREFALDKCNIALACRGRVKKVVQKLNLLMIESINDLNGSKEYPSQTPTELVVPFNIRSGALCYQVWVQHQDEKVVNQLHELLSSENNYYYSRGISFALGTAYNLGWIEYMGLREIEEIKSSAQNTLIDSALPLNKLEHIDLNFNSEEESRLIREELPVEFNQDRFITANGLADFIINMNGGAVSASVADLVFLDNGEKIVWMQ